jgi:hypothetical protein
MRFAVLLFALALVRDLPAQSATDSARARLVRINTDSTRAETCRNGRLSANGLSCNGATGSVRVTYIRRQQNRVDSLVQAWLARRPVDSVSIGFGPIATMHYASSVFGFPVAGVDTVTVCARIHYPDHSEKVGWPPVRVQFIGDSARITTRSGNPLTQMCELSMLRIMNVVAGDSVPVVWEAKWFTIRLEDGTTRRRLLPFAVPPQR